MNSMVQYDKSEFEVMQRMAKAMVESNYFNDTKSIAQAVVKMQAGKEVGIPPFASLAGINIIQGKPAFGANLIATLVDNHPRYDYHVIRADDEACVIEWFKDGKKAGESSFTMEEAKNIKQWNSKKNAFEPLTAKFNWQNWPSDMLFARAMTRGQKRFAAGVAGGAPLYTAEELGADYDENGNVVEGESVVVIREPKQKRDIIQDELDQLEHEVVEMAKEPEIDPMTIERACAIENSNGVRYGDLDSEKLSLMTIGIGKGLAKDDLTDEKRAFYEEKLEAIKVILRARDDGSI